MLKNLIQNNQLTFLNTLILALNLGIGGYCLIKTPQRIEVVDMAKLINDSAKFIAAKYPGGNVSQALMQQTIDELKSSIDEYGKQNKITILAKGAVLSGDFKDCTESITTACQEEK